MIVSIDGYTFDNCFYDREVDVLYLHQGPSRTAVEFDACPEGHHTRYDSDGNLVGITILNARRILQRDGVITVTLPDRVLQTRDLGDIVTAA